MTQKDLLSLEHLAIAEVTKFVHIHTNEGYVLTPWFEGMDILLYSGSVCYYMPIRDEYDDYRIITVEEHNELEKRREVAYAEVEEANKKELEDVE